MAATHIYLNSRLADNAMGRSRCGAFPARLLTISSELAGEDRADAALQGE